MKEYGEYYVEEDGSWLARWYGKDGVEEKSGKEANEKKAHEKGAAWIKSKGGK